MPREVAHFLASYTNPGRDERLSRSRARQFSTKHRPANEVIPRSSQSHISYGDMPSVAGPSTGVAGAGFSMVLDLSDNEDQVHIAEELDALHRQFPKLGRKGVVHRRGIQPTCRD